MDIFEFKTKVVGRVFKWLWKILKVILKPLYIILMYILAPSKELFEKLTDFDIPDVYEDAFPAFVTAIVLGIVILLMVFYKTN